MNPPPPNEEFPHAVPNTADSDINPAWARSSGPWRGENGKWINIHGDVYTPFHGTVYAERKSCE